MSMLWMEPFSLYGTSTTNMQAGTPWAAISGSLTADPDGVSTTKVFKLGKNDVGTFTRFTIQTAGDVHNLGLRVWLDQLPESTAHGQEIRLNDSGNSAKYALRTTPTGTIKLIRKTDATAVDESASVLTTGNWQHIEWSMNRTSGDYEVRVEGFTVLSGTDASPATGDSAIVQFVGSQSAGSGLSNSQMYIKDLFIADDAGTQNNGFIGPVTLYTLLADGDVSSGWTRSSGSSDSALVGVLTPNDANYIEADDSPPAASIMTFQDLPADVIGVRACMPVVRAFKTDGGDATLQNGLISSGDTDTGADASPGTSAHYQWDISELDPHTAALWTPVGVNAAELQLDRTT